MPFDVSPLRGTRSALSSLFARFTADRDAVLQQVLECQQSLAGLRARLDGEARGGAEPELRRQGEIAGHASRQAGEALTVAHEALDATARLAAELETRLRAVRPPSHDAPSPTAAERAVELAEQALRRADELAGLRQDVATMRAQMAQLAGMVSVPAGPHDGEADLRLDGELRTLREQLHMATDQAVLDRAACQAATRRALSAVTAAGERLDPMRAELTVLDETIRVHERTLAGLRGEVTRMSEASQRGVRDAAERQRHAEMRVSEMGMRLNGVLDRLVRLESRVLDLVATRQGSVAGRVSQILTDMADEATAGIRDTIERAVTLVRAARARLGW